MKNIIVNKITAVFLTLIMVFGLIPSVGFAQPNPASPLNEVKGFNISVFDSHFSRADREINPERWLAEAKIGITQAVYAWELIAFGMYENPFVFEEAKSQLEDWSNKELEARFSQWLLKRFFGETLGKAVADFSSMLGKTQKKYTWHLDDEGNVVFDEKTGDPLVIRPGEEGREFTQDRMIWQSEADELVEKNSSSFDTVMINMYPELLAYIPSELRETMNAAIKKAGMAANTSIKREFENIAAREQRIFTSRRTRDILSLRKKSDDEAARIFTEQLITETEQVCTKGIEDLNTKIEQAYTGTGDLALMGEEWLQLYKEQFDRGLKAWEEAEERFFIRRIEWEQDSFKLFSEGEEIWLTSFDKLNEEYQKWELKAKELFDTGEQLFKNISNNLEKSIADAKVEFEINKNMRIGTGTEKAKALIDMYITGASAAISAKENVQYWLKYYYEEKNVNDPDFTDWLLNERKNCWIQLERNYIQSSDYQSSLSKLTRLENVLLSLVTDDNKEISDLLQNLEDENNEESTEDIGKINAKLIQIAEDEYNEYLEKFNEKEIILLQIQDIISGKLSFTEEMAFAKKIEYSLPFNNYNYSMLCDLQKYYNLYSSYMEIALDARNKILADYAELLGTGALKDILSSDASTEDFYLDEYQLTLIRAKTLVLYWERKTSIAQAVISYLEKIDSGRMTEAESIQSWEKTKTAYNKSLALYETELNKLNKIGLDIQNQKTILDELAKKMSEEEEKLFRLSQEHSMLVARSYTSIGNVVETDFKNRYKFLIEEYNFFLKTGNNASYKDVLEYGMNWGIAQQKEDAEKLLATLINGDNSGTPSLAELENIVLLKTRFATIDLFADGPDYQTRSFNSAYSGADWYSKAKGVDLSEEEKTGLFGEKLGERLAADYNKSHLTLLKKRLDFELEILKNILDIDTEAEDYEDSLESAMAELTLNNLEEVAYIYDILINLKEMLDSNKGFFTEDNYENDIIEYFVLLGSFCNNTEQNLIDYYNDYLYCSNLLDLYYNYAAISSFGQKEIWQNSCNYIKTFIASYGLDTGEKFLPDAQSIYYAISKREGNLTENVILFFDEFQKYFSMAPKWLENEFSFWKNAVIEYISANISSSNNEKHWRQFLNVGFIESPDPLLAGLSTWKEGVIEDARFAAAYYTNRINDAFILFSQTSSSALKQTAQTLYNYYSYASSDIDNRFYSLNFYYNDLSRLGRALEISKLSFEEAKEQSDIIYKGLKVQEKMFNLSRDNYFFAAEIFLNTGSLYDDQYNIVKKTYEDTETKRFEYEKEDAIRRWASTAYLNTDTINYNDCKNKLEKAQIVLTVLLEINKNKEKRTYDNPEYNALYLEYEQSFIKKIKALDALEIVSSTSAQEYNNNDSLFNSYRNALLDFGTLKFAYTDKISIEIIEDWPYKDIITVKDGRLAFIRYTELTNKDFLTEDIFEDLDDLTTDILNTTKLDNSLYTFIPDTVELDNFFNLSKKLNGERHDISPFEEALRGLSQRMTNYLTDPDKLKQWSFAREYIISSLINDYPDLGCLPDYLSGLGKLEKEGSLGNELYKSGVMSRSRTLNYYFADYDTENVKLGSYAYWSFSEEERADLEFYVILTLLGRGNNYISGFSEIINFDLYNVAYNMVNDNYKYAANQDKKWYTLFFYDEMKDINKNTLTRIEPVLKETKDTINNFISGLKSNLSEIQNYCNAYLISCNNLKILNGEKENGQSIVWDDISNALTITREFNSEDISILRSCWDKMQETSFVSFQNLNDALSGLLKWTRSEETRLRNNLEKVWLADMQKQKNNESNYLAAAEAFISGTGNINTLKAAAENAYGKNSAVQKNHFENLYSTLIKDLSLYLTMENNFYSEFSSLGHEIELLTKTILENRYTAELTAREIEWSQMRTDILVKANEWKNSVSIILEKGRSEWDAGKQKMNKSYTQWHTNFQNEVRRVENEWAEAYLAGLEDKEKWLEQAATAFNQASAESFLQLVGMEGERLSRFMDTREPFGIRNAAPEAQAIMTELLKSSGIVNMTNAFSYINNITDTAASSVRRGLGGVSSWDAAVAKTAAKDIAKKTNAELADTEARKMAHTARTTVSEAISKLFSNVDDANKNFRESMDNQFIMEGLWRRNGKNYEKDIVKGSTLFQPVISQKQTVTGYKDYIMEPVSLQTNLDEKFLAEMNTIAIRAMIESAYKEVEAIAKEIFGDEKDKTPIKSNKDNKQSLKNSDANTKLESIIGKLIDGDDNLNKREQSLGKFGTHIGYQPDIKPSESFGNTRESIFYGEGGGELGRLMSDFIYWRIIDSKGSAELGLPFWDKRMWNDENSFFSAPSLRTVGQIATTVAVTIASGGTGIIGAVTLANVATTALVSSASNILFGTLDVACGYKTFGEAAFDIGKSYATNLVGISSSIGSSALGGIVKEISNPFLNVAAQTGVTGLQTVASSMATNAINSFTYNSTDGFGWSNEIFASGMKSTLTSAVTAMASTFTTQSLTAVNSGLDLGKLVGFSRENVIDIKKFNNLAGSLAGQGVNYAMGNDFTLNLLDISMFKDVLNYKDDYHSGLLELHLGSNGTTMNLGTGGANVSLDNLAASFRGLNVWDVNSRISRFIKKEDDFDSAIALRVQYGFGNDTQKGQLWDILNGKAIINTDVKGEFGAESVMNENGKKVITLAGYKSGMSDEDQLLTGVLLGHEAYRNGIITDDNYLETRAATLAHTEMALRMIYGGYDSIQNNERLEKDINAYDKGKEFFNNYVDNNYDSSGDYFRIYKDKDGKVTKVLDDGDIYHATIVEADGSERTVALQGGSITKALSAIAGNGMTPEEMNKLMVESGLWYEEGKAWYAKEDRGKYIPSEVSVNNGSGGLDVSLTDLREKATGLVNYAKDAVFSLAGEIKNRAGDIIGGIGKLLGFNPKPLTPDAQTDATNYWTVPGGDSKDSLTKFYSDLASIAQTDGYKEDDKTHCNLFVQDMIRKETDLYNTIFQGNCNTSNAVFDSFQNNKNLENIHANSYNDLQNIQKMADNGVLIMVVVKNPGGVGHIAFVGPSDLTYSTVYKDSVKVPDYENKLTTTKDLVAKGELYHVTVVQAGTYSGTTSIRYTTNGFLDPNTRKDILDNYMRFYAVKKTMIKGG